MEEKWGIKKMVMCILMLWSINLLKGANGLRFVIDREECFSHKVEYEGDTVHFSFVVIKVDSAWHSENEGVVDLVVNFLSFPFCNLFCGFALILS